jgi:putative phosphoesterase
LGVRIGLVADTHIPEAGPDLPVEAYAALAGCGRILHAGDLHVLDVVDRLEQVAPTLACRGNGDLGPGWSGRRGVPDDPRVENILVLEIQGLVIGVVHDIEYYDAQGEVPLEGRLDEAFGRHVDLVVCGHTHVPMVASLSGAQTIINPGSPTMPYGYLKIVGTVGFVDIDEHGFEVSVMDLATGQNQLRLRGGVQASCTYGPRPSMSRGAR